METRLHRPDRDSERGGDFGQWEVEVVMEDDHGPHLRLEPDEAAFELITVSDRRHVVSGDGCVQRGELEIDPMPAQSP